MLQTTATPVAPDDFLKANVEFGERAVFYPLGFPVEIFSNTTDLIEGAAHYWGPFSQSFDEPPIRLNLGVTPEDGGDLPPKPTFRTHENLLAIVSDGRNFIICDFSRHHAFGWLTRAVARNVRFAGYHFLTGAGMSLLVSRHLAPVHGALVAKNSRGVLLCGDSGAGKSTLAYACARAGWNYISDDGAYLLRYHQGCFGSGNPFTMHLREDAARLFPELAGRVPSVRPGGKIGFEVDTRDLPIVLATRSSIDHVVFLHRQNGATSSMEPLDHEEVIAWCERWARLGEEHVRAAQRQTYRRLLAAQTWRMHYPDVNAAIPLLEQLS